MLKRVPLSEKIETKLKKKVLAELKKLPNTYVVKIQQETIHGTLDIHICCRGFFIALELKSDPSLDLEPRQKYEADLIDKAWGIWFKVDPTNWPIILIMLRAFSIGLMSHAKLAKKN